MKGWSLDILEQKKSAATIRDYRVAEPEGPTHPILNPKTKIGGKIVSEFLTGDDPKSLMQNILLLFCLEQKLTLESEYRFSEKRRFRLDWCIESWKVGFEYEGIFSDKSRHTNLKGYSTDTDKYALAADYNFDVRRYTANNWERVRSDLNNIKKRYENKCK